MGQKCVGMSSTEESLFDRSFLKGQIKAFAACFNFFVASILSVFLCRVFEERSKQRTLVSDRGASLGKLGVHISCAYLSLVVARRFFFFFRSRATTFFFSHRTKNLNQFLLKIAWKTPKR